MQRLVIERGRSGDTGTFGSARLLSEPENDARYLQGSWHSLEPRWADNEVDVSCILPGLYIGKAEHSDKFGRVVYKLQDVPGRTNCELHPANWAGDTSKGLKSDLEGCTALGTAVGTLTPEGYAPQTAVENSGVALDELLQLTHGRDIEVEYVWSPGNEPGDWEPPPISGAVA